MPSEASLDNSDTFISHTWFHQIHDITGGVSVLCIAIQSRKRTTPTHFFKD